MDYFAFQDGGYNPQSSSSSSPPLQPHPSASWFASAAAADYYSATPWVVKKEANAEGY
jgi:hypothetical protein